MTNDNHKNIADKVDITDGGYEFGGDIQHDSYDWGRGRPAARAGSLKAGLSLKELREKKEAEKASEIHKAEYLSQDKTVYQMLQEDNEKLQAIIDKQAEQLKAKDEAIQAALRIKSIWLCPTQEDGPEVEDECKALVRMVERLEQALKGD